MDVFQNFVTSSRFEGVLAFGLKLFSFYLSYFTFASKISLREKWISGEGKFLKYSSCGALIVWYSFYKVFLSGHLHINISTSGDNLIYENISDLLGVGFPYAVTIGWFDIVFTLYYFGDLYCNTDMLTFWHFAMGWMLDQKELLSETLQLLINEVGKCPSLPPATTGTIHQLCHLQICKLGLVASPYLDFNLKLVSIPNFKCCWV